jgi:serine/threonine protein kinase
MTDSSLPAAVGRYKILDRLVGSSLDDVYRGFDPLIERPVVVKVFRLRLVDPSLEGAIKQSFYAEMQRTGLLMHHGIAQLFDAGEQPGALYMATEYVDGTSLAERLKTALDWDLSMRVSLIAQVLDALDFACLLGVPHLNLKPSNVVIGHGHAVKIGGFGVGSFVSQLEAASSVAVATPSPYAAPERLRGEPGDQRADVFSAARIARDVLQHGGPESESAAVSAVLARASSAKPVDRFPTPETLKQELLLALGVGESHVWFEPHVPSSGASDIVSEAETILTPSGVYVFPDRAIDPERASPAAGGDLSADGDAPTMMQKPAPKPPAKPAKG